MLTKSITFSNESADLNTTYVRYMYMNIPMSPWQSNRSVIPPCPGIVSPKSLMRKALLTPDAKKPPKGAIREAKLAITREWIYAGEAWMCV